MPIDPLESRMAHLEGAFEQVSGRLDGIDRRLDSVDRRLDSMDRRLDSMDHRLDGMFTLYARLDSKIDQRFTWTVGVVVSAWLTTIATILSLFLRLK